MSVGASLTIRSGRSSATVDSEGATLVDFRIGDDSLLSGPARVAPDLGHHGAVLAPWPNRLANGSFAFEGRRHQLPTNDPVYGHALHGLVFDQIWHVRDFTPSTVTMEHELRPMPGYPFRLRLTVHYALDDATLHCTAKWQNQSATHAPFGIGFHPYFRPGPSPIEEWRLQVPASTFLGTDRATALPTELRDVDGSAYDFRTPRALGEDRFSVAYRRPGDQADLAVTVTDTRGRMLSIAATSEFRWVQVFSGHLPDAGLSRRGLAIEPQTCPPNAFVSGQDVIAVAPGETGQGAWSVNASRAG